MSEKKVIVFDFGNVLAGFDHMKICRVLTEYFDYSADEIYKRIFKSGIEKEYDERVISSNVFFQKVVNALNKKKKLLLFDDFKSIWGDIFTENPCIMDVLDRIKSDSEVELYLLSNTNWIHWTYIEKLPVVYGHFSNSLKQILSFRVGARKPSEKIFIETLERVKVRPESVLYIDDIPEYVIAFEKLGVNGFVYNCQKDPISKLEAELSRFGVL